jgi:hypothetical protein
MKNERRESIVVKGAVAEGMIGVSSKKRAKQ